MHPAERLRASASDGPLSGKHLLLCVTGSIAAVEDVKLVREFLRHGADVTVAMTEAATRIIHPESLWFASGKKVITALDGDVQHVTLCGQGEGGVDAVLVAPCSANMISKLATGVCDDAVSTMLVTALGSGKRIIIAPGMHGDMWGNKIIQENLGKLEKLGIVMVPPAMDEGKAKMADLETIFLITARALRGAPMKGKKVAVIGGSTAEPIDAVRVITNYSTGRTPVALAKEAYMLGADVELIMGRASVDIPKAIPCKRFASVLELKKMVSGRKFGVVLVPAAISDYIPESPVRGKIPSDRDSLTVKLKKAPKIIDSINAKSIIGAKLEVGVTVDELKRRAKERMRKGGMSAIVANRLEDVSDTVSTVYLIDKSGRETTLKGTREEISRAIMAHVIKVLK